MSTGKLRFLTLVKPVLHVLPEVAQPDRKIPFKVRQPRDSHMCFLAAARRRIAVQLRSCSRLASVATLDDESAGACRLPNALRGASVARHRPRFVVAADA